MLKSLEAITLRMDAAIATGQLVHEAVKELLPEIYGFPAHNPSHQQQQHQHHQQQPAHDGRVLHDAEAAVQPGAYSFPGPARATSSRRHRRQQQQPPSGASGLQTVADVAGICLF